MIASSNLLSRLQESNKVSVSKLQKWCTALTVCDIPIDESAAGAVEPMALSIVPPFVLLVEAKHCRLAVPSAKQTFSIPVIFFFS